MGQSNTMATHSRGRNWWSGEGAGYEYETDGAFSGELARSFKTFFDGTSFTVVASEIISGKDDYWERGMKFDSRGLWAWNMIGSHCYTYLHPPNSPVGDYMWDPGGSEECIHWPADGLPCRHGADTRFFTMYALGGATIRVASMSSSLTVT